MSRICNIAALVVLFSASPPAFSDAQADAPRYRMYTVRAGDTLSHIARRFRVSIQSLQQLNRIRRAHIRPGQRLKIRRLSPRRGSDDVRSARSKRRTRARAARGSSGRWITHRVRRGDYLWGIADRYDVTVTQLRQRNGIRRGRHLRPGQVLRIKRRGSQILRGGVTLPAQGPGYRRIRPANSWGTPGTIRWIQEVYREFALLHPDSVPAIVADISREGGGHLRPHRSHQRGVDADISYYKLNNERSRGLEVVTAETIDIAKSWDALRLFLNTGHVTLIFMDYELQKVLHTHLTALGYEEELLERILQYPRSRSERRGIIRHSPGHHHHFHVRFDCLQASDTCARPAVALVPPPPRTATVAETDGSAGPNAESADAENADAENADAENADAENADAENADAENADAENPSAASTAVAETDRPAADTTTEASQDLAEPLTPQQEPATPEGAPHDAEPTDPAPPTTEDESADNGAGACPSHTQPSEARQEPTDYRPMVMERAVASWRRRYVQGPARAGDMPEYTPPSSGPRKAEAAIRMTRKGAVSSIHP